MAGLQGENLMGYSWVTNQGNFIHRTNVRLVFSLSVIVTWTILMSAIHPMITYTSQRISVLGKYSTPYAILLTFYLITITLWPLLLGSPERLINRVAQTFRHLQDQLRSHIWFSAGSFFLALLTLILIQIWGWGQGERLRFSILLMGLWLSVVPTFWHWGLQGWPVTSPKVLLNWLYFRLTVDRILWLRPLIIAGVLLLSVGLAINSPSPRQILPILALIPAIGGVLIFLRWPPLGLLVVVATLVGPIEGPSGSNMTLGVVALLLVLGGLDVIVHQRRIKLVASRPIGPLLLLVLIASLAFAVGQLPWYTFARPAPIGAQLGGLFLFILSAGAFLLAAHQIQTVRWLQWLTWVFFLIAGISVIGRLIGYLGLRSLGYYVFMVYSRGSDGSILWTWLIVLSFSQAVFNNKLHLGWRAVIGGLAVASLYMALFPMRAWNSGWVPALVAVTVTVWAANPRLTVPLVLVGLLGATTQIQKLVDFIMIGDNEYSLSTRLEAWSLVLEMAKINPILGLGPANYYYYTPLFPIRGYAVQFNSHSQYVDLIAQTGVLGLICFCWFFVAVGLLAWQLRERVPAGFPRAYVYGTLGGVVGTLVSAAFGDWVIPFFYNVGLVGFSSSVLAWLFTGGLVALEQMAGQPSVSLEPVRQPRVTELVNLPVVTSTSP